VVWFSDPAASLPAAWPWAGFIPGRDGAETAEDAAQSHFLLISEAPFLAGHFPGRPILPGVAIIDAALMVCRAAAGARHLRLDAISAARFFAAVLPGDEVTLRAVPSGAGTWRAAAHANGVLCARMTLHVTEQAAAPRHAAAPRRPHFDVGAAASYSWKNYKVSLFGKNLTNHKIEYPFYIAPLFAASTITPGASWGVELAAKF